MELFDREYFEIGSYGKQDFKIIERNYKNLLDKGFKYFPEISRKDRIKILDFGCAFGVGTNYLSSVFSKGLVVGVDISEYAVQKANKLFSNKKNLKFHCLDLSKTKSLNFLLKNYGYFDMIFTRDVLEHVPKKYQKVIVKNFSIILKNGGIVMASIANGLNLYSFICDKTHIGLRSPWFWRNVFSKYMKVIKCFEMQWIPFLWRLRKDKKLIEIRFPLLGFIVYLFAKKEYGRRNG